MDLPLALSLEEIRKYMLLNNCKVTNHALVKHFRKFLTNPDSQEEARKLFKSYVNILATMKNENNEKYLVLRKKYLHECPPEDIVNKTIDCPSPASPGNSSIASDNFGSPFRQPPPYKPPPEVSPNVSGLPKIPPPIQQQQQSAPISYGIGIPKEMTSNYRDCVNEFAAAVRKIDPNRITESTSVATTVNDVVMQEQPPTLPPRKRASIDQSSNSSSLSRENSREENKENVDGKGTVPEKNIGQRSNDVDNKLTESENQMSVKEATRKFNRMASEEEAKVVSPPSKKKPEKTVEETPEVTLGHPKAKEWLVSAAKANYQELAKLLADYSELVRLQDPSTGYTGLHWAAKHGNEDVVKLIAGTYKADVNAKTNGGYTPLHLAMQFGRDNIFELLCNVYKANRDITDWSGNKPLDYRRQRTTVSASTYSSEYFEFLIQNQQLLQQQQQELQRTKYPGSLKHKKSHRNTSVFSSHTMSSSGPLQRAKSLMVGKGKKYSPISNRKHYQDNKRMSHNMQPSNTVINDGFDELDEGLIPVYSPRTSTTLQQPLKKTGSTRKKVVVKK